MTSELLNPRRAPRAPARFQVEVKDRFANWPAETEDLGPRGCQLVAARLASPGRELTLSVRCPPLGRQIRAVGRVVWSRPEAPSRLGVEFDPARTDAGWFEPLLRGEPALAAAVARVPERLSRNASLHLGEPPLVIADFNASEVAVLRRVGRGTTPSRLAAELGSVFERLRSAVFGLLARRRLTLLPAEAVDPARWERTLRAAERALAAEGTPIPGPVRAAGPGRAAAAQVLFDEGLAHLTAGRIEVAVARLREAQRLAPHDSVIGGALQRLAPWAS